MAYHTGNNTNITIRPLNETGIPMIYGFFNGFPGASRKFYHPYTFDQDAISVIARQLHDGNCIHLGAFHDDGSGEKLVGYVWYVHREESSYPLLGIGVVDTFQNVSISKGLTQRIERVARDRVDLLSGKLSCDSRLCQGRISPDREERGWYPVPYAPPFR